MKLKINNLASEKYRWLALIFLALSLAIIIIDNTVLNVAIPYILKDLNSSLGALEWVISGYALIIATLLITAGRLGDIYGRKKIFLIGLVLFATGSFIASISTSVFYLFIGEALIEAIGASMMMTSSLALLVNEFRGKERAIAFGVWGSVAGASAAVGPLLGGYLTTYHSWRWSLRINVIVALIAIFGSVFIKESTLQRMKRFDWMGTVYSGLGLFSLIFGILEGDKFGWLAPRYIFSIYNWQWPFAQLSIIPIAFVSAVYFLVLFFWHEHKIEKNNGDPLLKISLFKNRGFSLGLLVSTILPMIYIGAFFVLPIFLENVLGINAFKAGLILVTNALAAFVFGPLSGFVASKIKPKYLVNFGIFCMLVGTLFLIRALNINITAWSVVPALILIGAGIGMTSAQITNITISAVSVEHTGEASAVSSTVRQLGSSLAIAIIGSSLAVSLPSFINANLQADNNIPPVPKYFITSEIASYNFSSGQRPDFINSDTEIGQSIKNDINQAFVDSSKKALNIALVFVVIGFLLSLFLPKEEGNKKQSSLNRTPFNRHK